ncbi:MAG TPA: Hsp20/alpha crystallin family protein [Actinoplanes sp.]|nr:Hsp20/alpha crystallin family protein [Actinoplanes sp.]
MVLTFDPFRELDRLADRMLGAPAIPGTAAVAMPTDLYRSGDHFVLHCDLAGIDPGSIAVDVDGRVLTIRAERSARTDADVQWLRRERATGTFERRFTLGDGLDLSRIDATWNDGVLTVTIPRAEAAKPRRIEITTGHPAALPHIPGRPTDTATPTSDPVREKPAIAHPDHAAH